jgi:molybdopterin molybdotransferase
MVEPAPGLLELSDAVEELLAGVAPRSAREEVAVADGLGRVLAADVVSQVEVPPADNSAMDGYALRAADAGDSGASLPVVQRIFAGQVGEPLAPNTAARIFTGAPLPAGADAVVPQESVSLDGDQVVFSSAVSAGANVRRAGESVRRGDVVLAAGRRLGPQDLAIAASVGTARLGVHGRPRVATFSTGDELRQPGEALGPGQIYDANRPMLAALIHGLGCEAVDLGRVPDDRARTLEVLREAGQGVDAIVTSGGVSVGEADHVHEVARELGELSFWKVAIKPGKPVAFGRIGDAGFLGLPGNPVSAFVTFCLFARPYLLALAGRRDLAPVRRRIAADFEHRASPTRREFLRVRCESDPDGQEVLRSFDRQGSHVLGSLAWANGLAEIPAGTTVERGDVVHFWPFAELLR